MKMFNKQKLLALGVCAIFLAVAFIISPVSPVMAQEIRVTINGQTVQFPDQKPYINEDNRTLVPVRAPMEAAGATVTWNGTARQATVDKDDKTAVFTIGSKQYTVNGENKKMDTEARITGNRTVFPIRFVAEAIGLTVSWDEKTQTVGIMSTTEMENNPEITPGTTQPEETAPSTQNQEPMTSLIPEAKARLMAYPYLDKDGKPVEVYTKMVEKKEKCIKQGAKETFLQNDTQSVLDQKALIKPTQKFFFDSDLCFTRSGKYPSRVRGVLQTRNNDGTITEQDVEFGFKYGTHFVSEGETCEPSHWLEGNDFITLAPPVII